MLYLSQLGKLNARQTLEEIAIKQNIMTIPEVFQPYFKDRYIQVKGRNFQVASEVMLSQLKKNVIEISLPIHFDKIKTTHQQRNELRAEIIILRNKVNKLKTMNKDIVEALSYSVGNYLMAMERDIDWSEGLAFHKTTFQMKWRTPEDKKLLAWINKMQQRNVIKVYPQHRALKLTSIQN
jgi:ribosomal protein L24